MQSRSTVVAALAVAGALALSACSGGDDPAPTSSTSTSSSSSSSTTPSTTTTPPTTSTTANVAIPPEAQKHTEEGAKAFAKFYFTSVNESLTRADPDVLSGLAAETCAVCTAFTDGAQKYASKRQHLERAVFDIKLVHLGSFEKGTAVVDVAGDQLRVRVLDEKGDVVETTEKGVATFRTHLARTASAWQVSKVEVL